MTCRVCNYYLSDKILVIKEKMFGTNELFEYQVCPSCNCIQIKTVPKNLQDYYPLNYYSFKNHLFLTNKRSIEQFVLNILSFLKRDFYKRQYFINYGIHYSDKNKAILDIGCGEGNLLGTLRNNGFSNLTGIDPYIEHDRIMKGFKILKDDLESIDGRYELIMSHHSLEHMPDPHHFFKNIVRLLDDGGRVILRIPVYPNYIWNKYGTDWIQLDAPRHLFTFSLKSIEFLCKIYNLYIKEIIYDSAPWSLASTEYCMNGRSHKEFEQNVLITKEQTMICKEANENRNGDSVCLTLALKSFDCTHSRVI